MNIEDIHEMVKAARAERFQNSPQLSLGQLIEQLETVQNKSVNVEYDFGTAIPTRLASWRGIYAELALGYRLSGYDNREQSTPVTVKSLLKELKEAIGYTYEGWKGGDYTMDENTPIWIANPGNSGNTAVVGILDKEYEVVLITMYMASY